MGYGYNGWPQVYSPYGQPSGITPPTRHAEIVQVDGEETAASYPVGAGCTQMMMAQNESAIYIKSVALNGQVAFDVFERRPPKPAFDPADFVRRDEIASLIAEAMGMTKQEGQKG